MRVNNLDIVKLASVINWYLLNGVRFLDVNLDEEQNTIHIGVSDINYPDKGSPEDYQLKVEDLL